MNNTMSSLQGISQLIPQIRNTLMQAYAGEKVDPIMKGIMQVLQPELQNLQQSLSNSFQTTSPFQNSMQPGSIAGTGPIQPGALSYDSNLASQNTQPGFAQTPNINIGPQVDPSNYSSTPSNPGSSPFGSSIGSLGSIFFNMRK